MACNLCKNDLPIDGDYVTCGKCNSNYHFDCSVLKVKTWKAKSQKAKSEWECINCRSSKPRTQSTDLDGDIDEPAVNSLKRFIEELFKKQEKTLVERVNNIMGVVTQIEEKFMKTLDKMKELEEKTISLEKEMTDMKLTLELEKQYGRSRNFVITSIPYEEKEDVREAVVNLLGCMDIDVNKGEITAHRLPSKSKPAPIIVQCMARESRDNIVRKARKFRPKTSLLKRDGHPDKAIYFNDHLTPYFSDLMAKANKARKGRGYRFIWMNGNKIMIKKDNLSKAIQIIKEEDLQRIV